MCSALAAIISKVSVLSDNLSAAPLTNISLICSATSVPPGSLEITISTSEIKPNILFFVFVSELIFRYPHHLKSNKNSLFLLVFFAIIFLPRYGFYKLI